MSRGIKGMNCDENVAGDTGSPQQDGGANLQTGNAHGNHNGLLCEGRQVNRKLEVAPVVGQEHAVAKGGKSLYSLHKNFLSDPIV